MMKNIFKIFLGIALALNSTSCEDEKRDTWLNSMVPYNMIIGIFDEDGNNLLSESAEGNWLYAPISISINDYPKNLDWECFRPQQAWPWVNIDPTTGAETSGLGEWAGIIRTDRNTPIAPTEEMVDSYAIMISEPLFPDEKNEVYLNFLELNQVVQIEFGSYLADRESPDGKKYSCYVNGIGNPVDDSNYIIPVRIVLPHRATLPQGE